MHPQTVRGGREGKRRGRNDLASFQAYSKMVKDFGIADETLLQRLLYLLQARGKRCDGRGRENKWKQKISRGFCAGPSSKRMGSRLVPGNGGMVREGE